MKAEDLRSKSVDELKKLVLDLSKQQMNLRFQKAGAQLESTAEIRKVRRSIARTKTILTEKQAAAKKSA